MAVQQKVERSTEVAAEVVGIVQGLVVARHAALVVVMDHAQPKPALLLVVPQVFREPAQLLLAEVAVVVLIAVALGHRGVQAGDHELEVVVSVQAPRLVGGEFYARSVPVKSPKHLLEVFPLWPVRPGRFFVVGLAFHEVGRKGIAVDVMVAGDDHHPLAREFQDLGQPGEEVEDIFELLFLSPLGEVTGRDHEVRDKTVLVFQQSQVVTKAREQRIEGSVGLR
jgi:hypothetical protein